METIEARITSLQSFKRDIVSEIVSDRNAHSFATSTSNDTSGGPSAMPPGGASNSFGGALWSSVKSHAIGDEVSGVGSTSSVGRYQTSRSQTYQKWMEEVSIYGSIITAFLLNFSIFHSLMYIYTLRWAIRSTRTSILASLLNQSRNKMIVYIPLSVNIHQYICIHALT